MATFVKLTRDSGDPVWVNPEQVCAVSAPIPTFSPADAKAHLMLANGSTYVTEDLPIVIALLRNPDAKA